MYELLIKTKYNEITIVVDDLEDELVQEIINQPYVLEVRPKIFTGDIEKAKILKKEIKNDNKRRVKENRFKS